MSDLSQSVWCVRGPRSLWVVRAESEEQAITVALDGPAPGGDLTAKEYGLARDDLDAVRVEDGPAAIVDGHMG